MYVRMVVLQLFGLDVSKNRLTGALPDSWENLAKASSPQLICKVAPIVIHTVIASKDEFPARYSKAQSLTCQISLTLLTARIA